MLLDSEFKIFDKIVLKEDIPLSEGGIAEAGTEGTIIDILQEGKAYIVELFEGWVKTSEKGYLIPTTQDDPESFMETIGVEVVLVHQIKEVKKMTIKEAMAQAQNYPGSTGIFYHPVKKNAIIVAHGKSPKDYLLWCDCSVAYSLIAKEGSVDAAYDIANEWHGGSHDCGWAGAEMTN